MSDDVDRVDAQRLVRVLGMRTAERDQYHRRQEEVDRHAHGRRSRAFMLESRLESKVNRSLRGFCVSTVSIVSGRAPGSTAVVVGCISAGGWLDRRSPSSGRTMLTVLTVFSRVHAS